MSDLENNKTGMPETGLPLEPEPNAGTAPAAEAEKGAEIMEKYEVESRTRTFSRKWMEKLFYGLCLLFTLYHLAYASGLRFLQMVNIKHHAIHVGLILVLGFALYPATKKSSRKSIPWYDWIFIGLSALIPFESCTFVEMDDGGPPPRRATPPNPAANR